MNPKDMTGRALFIASKDSYSSKKQHAGISLLNWIKDQEAIELELLRRLDEADALRKENEELRKDKERIDFLDDGNYGIDPRNIPGVMMNGRRFHCLAGRGDWSSLRDAIDAARLAKES